MNNEQIVAENEQIQSNEPTTMVQENGIDLSTEITKTEEVLLEEVKNDDSANSVIENQTLSNEIVQTASALETIESSTTTNEIILEEFVDVVKDENQEVLTTEQNIDVTPEVNIEAKKNESDDQQTQSTEQIEKESKIIEDKKEDDSKTTVVESIEPNKTKRIPKERYDELFNRLAEFKERNEPFEVYVKARVKGGLRVFYEDVPLFLPVSHFSMRKTPTEQELKATEGTKLKVHVHELQEYEEGRKTAIVTRKQVLIEELWNNLQIGDIVEGRVSSIASFGVFLDLGGIEGLIHVSRLSQFRIENPNDVFKKGDLVRAVVVELDKERNRIALSRKELEESPWKNIEQEFPPQSRHMGTIRKLTEFGAYVELKPGVDGLLRTPEISWTKRIKKPSEVLKLGQKIEVEVLAVSEEKRTIALSYKKTIPNPWFSLVDRFPVGTTLMGKVSQVLPQGMVVSISDDVDGFMPRSKMRPLLKGNKIPYHSGDQLEVIIADLIPDEESLILSPKIDENMAISASETDDYKSKRSNQQPQGGDNKANKQALNQNAVTLVDLLSESDRNSLLNL